MGAVVIYYDIITIFYGYHMGKFFSDKDTKDCLDRQVHQSSKVLDVTDI